MLEDILLVCVTPIYVRSWVDAQLTNREVPSDQQTGIRYFQTFPSAKMAEIKISKMARIKFFLLHTIGA